MSDKQLNPEVKEIKIGIRELRSIKIYPLSFRDQSSASDLISESMQKLLEAQNRPDIVFVTEILNMITENADRILSLVMDPAEKGDDILGELSNQQLLEIAETIYDVNYAHLQKKVRSLFGIVEKVSQSLPERPLPQS